MAVHSAGLPMAKGQAVAIFRCGGCVSAASRPEIHQKNAAPIIAT
jgi:hypothetical protein